MTALRILYFGTPQFAVPSLEHLLASPHTVVGVVTQPDRPRGRGQRVTAGPVKALAEARGIPVFQPIRLRDEDTLAPLRALEPDLGVVAAYGRILPQALLDLPPRGLINVHASLLPRWRGAAPVHRAVLAGDAETGVTIMRVVAALDAGPMLASCRVPIGPDDTSESLEARLAQAGATLLVDTVHRLAAGAVPEEPQDDALVTYAHRLERHESRIDWTQPAEVIARRVRGLQPWPLAVAVLEGRRLALLRASVVTAPAVDTAPPGTVVRAEQGTLHVACGSGVLSIDALTPEGRRPMTTRDFLNGAAIRPGSTLT